MAGARDKENVRVEEPKSAEQVFAAARSRQAAGPQVYVVQVLTAGEATSADGEPATGFGSGALWMDLASVTVPPRSKRKPIIERALNSERGRELTLPVTLRILDADAAREFPVGLRPRDPELVIG